MIQIDEADKAITCHYCGTEFLPTFSDAPRCPACNAINVDINKKTKRKNTENYDFGELAPKRFKVQPIDGGVEISWQPGSIYFVTISIVFVWILLIGFGINFYNIETHILNGFILILSLISVIALRLVLNRKIITITDVDITDEMQPLTWPYQNRSYPIHIIQDVFVKENLTRMIRVNDRYGYDIILTTIENQS
ncbi:MAG: hypothetical protein AAFY41_11275, partial [Bacteroidota bacterium]